MTNEHIRSATVQGANSLNINNMSSVCLYRTELYKNVPITHIPVTIPATFTVLFKLQASGGIAVDYVFTMHYTVLELLFYSIR